MEDDDFENSMAEYDEGYERVRSLLLEQLRHLDQEYKMRARPIIDKLAQLEAYRPSPFLRELSWKTIT
jgi:hypothetical protein